MDGYGPFPDAQMGPPPGAIHVNDYHGHNDDYYDNGGGGKQKYNNHSSNKKKNDQYDQDRNRRRVQTKYEGYTIYKAEGLPGYKSTWTRAGRKPMQFDQKELIRQAKKGSDPKYWANLGSNKQGVVNQLVEQRNADEHDGNAKWVIAGVIPNIVGGGWFGTKAGTIKSIIVILKRTDQNSAPGTKSKARREPKQFQPHEIIDITKPVKSKNKNKHQGGNHNSSNNHHQDEHGYDDQHYGGGGNHDNFHHPAPPPMMNPMPPPNHFDNFGPQPVPVHDPYVAVNQPPHAPMPYDQFPPGPPPLQRHHSGRHPQFHSNPFQGDPNLVPTGPYDMPPEIIGDEFLHQGPSPRERSRRRSSARRENRTARQLERLNDQVDDLAYKMDKWNLHGGPSSEDAYSDEPDSIFSRAHRGYIYDSPPSSPHSAFSIPRGSLDRNGKGGNRARYRSQRYRDTDIVPARAYRDGELRRRNSEVRRRPKLHHAHTYDDYPMGRGTESRYLTDERYDYERGRRDGRRNEYDLYDQRDFDRGMRRRNSIGGGGGRYYH